MMKVGPKLS